MRQQNSYAEVVRHRIMDRPHLFRRGDIHLRLAATRWLDNQAASIVSGTHVAPRDAQLTVQQWCDLCIEGYKVNRDSTVRQARTHIHQIVDESGDMPLSVLRPSQVKAWVARLQAEGLSQNYVYSLLRGSRRSCPTPCMTVSGPHPVPRRTAPPMGNFRLDDKAVMATGGPIVADSALFRRPDAGHRTSPWCLLRLRLHSVGSAQAR